MRRIIDVVSSTLASTFRLGAGLFAIAETAKPAKPLELYEFEACPFCRKVREALTELDLDAMIYPCPKKGTVNRPRLKELGGKMMVPFLVDPNHDAKMYESDAIVSYLWETYANRKPPLLARLGSFNTSLSTFASGARPLCGLRSEPSKRPKKPLELYSFEGSPYCRLVRETLCELEIPYLLHNVGKGKVSDFTTPGMRRNYKATTPNREAFIERSGKMQVPFLIDPNTGREMFESAAIRQYLLETYGA